MTEYIERDIALKKFEGREKMLNARLRECKPSDANYSMYAHKINELIEARGIISSAPAAPVALVVHGRWVPYNNEQDKGFHHCSVCKAQAFNYWSGNEVVEVLSKFCYECGAKMDAGCENG